MGDGTAVWAHTVVLHFLIRKSLATYHVVGGFFVSSQANINITLTNLQEMAKYLLKISGVHYAANPEAEAGMPDTEEMHVRTRELLARIDRGRPLVSLFAEPTNLFNPDCFMAQSRGVRIGRVADECVAEVKSLMAQSGETMLFAQVEEVVIREHGYLMVSVEADELTSMQPLQSSMIDWGIWLKEDMMRMPPHQQELAEIEACYYLKRKLLPQRDTIDVVDLEIYLGIMLKGIRDDMSREAREACSHIIAELEKSKRKEVRLLGTPLKELRTSICGRMALRERATKWWTQRLESDDMKRLWLQWWVANNGQLWDGMRAIDEQLRKLPGQLYLDIGKREIVLSRLYYMNTPRKALEAILTMLMLRELTCRHLGLDMKPMIESEYGSDRVMDDYQEGATESHIYLNTARGQKIDLIRVLNVMFEQGRFTGKNGAKLTKKDFFTEMGRLFHVDLSNYDKDLSRSMSDGTKLEKHLMTFDHMKEKMIELWNSR